mmetsp:Transcript_2940/g.4833  ORF Transcript_2940/g.4833 Transcript_2940/m.4833 type:complete len:121 (+) Transcript_2940:2712-3074(+)
MHLSRSILPIFCFHIYYISIYIRLSFTYLDKRSLSSKLEQVHVVAALAMFTPGPFPIKEGTNRCFQFAKEMLILCLLSSSIGDTSNGTCTFPERALLLLCPIAPKSSKQGEEWSAYHPPC